jgi:elongation factor G
VESATTGPAATLRLLVVADAFSQEPLTECAGATAATFAAVLTVEQSTVAGRRNRGTRPVGRAAARARRPFRNAVLPMSTKELDKLRNIGIMAHIDAGKTTVTERILFYTGKTYKMGEVHEGTAVMDFDPEEQSRGITISAAATTCLWRGLVINLIDTPGHVDFTAEVERSLRVLDGAVAVFCGVGGVEAQSETVWRQADRYRIPRLVFVNKLDRVGSDYRGVLQEIRERLHGRPVPVVLPLGREAEFRGLIDVLDGKGYVYADELGTKLEETRLSDEEHLEAEIEREHLVEQVAEFDDELMHAYVEHQPAGPELLRRAIRRGTLLGRIQPALGGAALKNRGIQMLLDAVIDYLPSPLDVGAYQAHSPKDPAQVVEVHPKLDEPFAGLAFKITSDKHGDMTWVRIYSGSLKSGVRVLNVTRGKKEVVSRLWRLHADELQREEIAYAGDIVAAVGPKDTVTGDTLCDAKRPLLLERMHFPKTVVAMSIEPKSSAERDRLGEVLRILAKQDPTFQYRVDAETGQTIVAGMGELHLEVLKNRMQRDFNVEARIGTPRVAYRETIRSAVEAEGRLIRQTGGHGQFAVVFLRVEPYKSQDEETTLTFVDDIKGGTIDSKYVDSVEEGVREAALAGIVSGYPLIDVKVTLLDGKEHPVDSSELAFEAAGAIALRLAVEKAGIVLLEPLMKVEVVSPNEFVGEITGDLMSRRATVTASDLRGQLRVIDALAPLAEMFGYATALRGLTQGRASYTMEPHLYAPVPQSVAEKLSSGLW